MVLGWFVLHTCPTREKRGPRNGTLRFPLDSRVTRNFMQSLASTKVVLKVELLLIYLTFFKKNFLVFKTKLVLVGAICHFVILLGRKGF